jgi:hypothetical protein
MVKMNAYRDLLGKPEREGRPRYTWEDNITMDVKNK